MGRGAGNINLTGQDLQKRVWISREALENWAHFRGGHEEMIIARRELLGEITKSGKIIAQPRWMTSPKEGVEAYIELPGEVWLTLKKSEKPAYTWMASNAIATKKVRKSAGEKKPLKYSHLAGEDLEKAITLTPAQIVAKTRISRHALERFQERGEGDLLQILSRSARVQREAPAWADASNRGGAVILAEVGEDQVAMPLMPNFREEEKDYVAATFILKSWVEESLDQLRGEKLAEKIHVSSHVARKVRHEGEDIDAARERVTHAIRESSGIHRDGSIVKIKTDLGELTLNPASEEHYFSHSKAWNASKIQPR